MAAPDVEPEEEDCNPKKDVAEFDDFTIGSVVQLRSGGPMMTVAEVFWPHGSKEEKIDCVWFDDAQLQHGRFPPRTLKLNQ